MTRKEAIIRFERQLKAAQVVLDSGFGSNPGESDRLYRERKEMAEIALAALCGPTREQVEKVWKGCEKCNGAGEYSRYAENLTKTLLAKYCPHCGRPLTDEAVEITLRRLEALHENDR